MALLQKLLFRYVNILRFNISVTLTFSWSKLLQIITKLFLQIFLHLYVDLLCLVFCSIQFYPRHLLANQCIVFMLLHFLTLYYLQSSPSYLILAGTFYLYSDSSLRITRPRYDHQVLVRTKSQQIAFSARVA